MENLKSLFVPYVLAKIAKEKGFNEPCFAWFDSHAQNEDEEIELAEKLCGIKNSDLTKEITLPIYSQMLDWFRIKHKMHIYIDRNICEYAPLWIEDTTLGARSKRLTEHNFDTYEQAINEAINEAFKLI